SSEIVPYTARGFRGVFDVALNIVTPNLLDSIDIMNRWLHESVNRAIYLAGFSTE
ncbi:MAG: glutathionyl-hydroquinone reductase, partial [Cellvibrionaceae bacterium]